MSNVATLLRQAAGDVSMARTSIRMVQGNGPKESAKLHLLSKALELVELGLAEVRAEHVVADSESTATPPGSSER